MYSGPPYKSCQPCHCGPHRSCPVCVWGGSWEKHKKIFFFETTRPRAFIFCVQQCIVVLFINPANRGPGVHTGPALGALSSAIGLQWKIHEKIFFSETTTANASFFFGGALHKSCQAWPWGQKWPTPGGVKSSLRLTIGKKKHNNLLLQNHMAQSFHMLCGLYKCCQRCPWGP